MPQDLGAILQDLATTLESRKRGDPQTSYVARLYQQGLDEILKKVGEEAAETLIAAKNPDRDALVHEVADLFFHTLIMLAHQNVPLDAIGAELARRNGRSGLDEKASRSPPD